MRSHRTASLLGIFVVEYLDTCGHCTSEFGVSQGKPIDRTFRRSMPDSTASVVRSFSAAHSSFQKQTSSVARNVAIVCAMLISRQAIHPVRTRPGNGDMRTSIGWPSEPLHARGSDPALLTTFWNDVDDEWLAIAAPTMRDTNCRLNSNARGFRAAQPPAQGPPPFRSAQPICNTAAAISRRTGMCRDIGFPWRRPVDYRRRRVSVSSNEPLQRGFPVAA
jgi:hypothetical protein